MGGYPDADTVSSKLTACVICVALSPWPRAGAKEYDGDVIACHRQRPDGRVADRQVGKDVRHGE